MRYHFCAICSKYSLLGTILISGLIPESFLKFSLSVFDNLIFLINLSNSGSRTSRTPLETNSLSEEFSNSITKYISYLNDILIRRILKIRKHIINNESRTFIGKFAELQKECNLVSGAYIKTEV